QGFVVVGARQVDIEFAFTRNNSEVQFLGVYIKPVARTQLNNISTLLKNIGLVAQRAQGLTTNGFETRIKIVRFYGIVQLPQLLDQIANLQHQRIRREIGI